MSGLYWPSGSGDVYSETANASNLSISCVARYIGSDKEQLSYSAAFVTAIRAFLAVSYFLLFCTGLLLNIFLIALIAKYKRLQTYSFGIAFQLAVLNTILSVMFFTGFASSVAGHWLFGEIFCTISGMVIYIATTVRTLLMAVFVIDRVLSVFVTFSYPEYQCKVLIALCLFTWLFPIATSFLLVSEVLDCIGFHTAINVCIRLSHCNSACSHFNTSFIFVAAPATIVPIILYSLLYIKAWKIRREAKVLSGSAKQEHDWKATITFFLLFITVFALILPGVVVLVIINRFYEVDERPTGVYAVSVIIILLMTIPPVTDAIVLMRNKDVKEVVRELRSKLMKKCFNVRAKDKSK